MKSLRITLLLLPVLLTIMALVSTIAPAKADAPAVKLLSAKQPVKASSAENDELKAANVVDGDENTRWSSAFEDKQWIYVDLGAAKSIAKVKIKWETAAGKDYDIEVSDDATKWTSIKSIKDNSATGWLDYADLTGKGRYVRLNLKTRATEYGFSILELEVYGN